MGRYQAYPEYKDSAIDWLEKIPAHWAKSKIRYMFTFNKGLTITKENLQDEGVPCLNYGEIHSKFGFEFDPQIHELKFVNEQYLKSSKNSLLAKGDLIFADTSEDIDGSGNFTQLISDKRVFAGYHTIILRPVDKQTYRFYAYLFDSKELRTQIRHAVKGVKVFSITQAILKGVDIWLPSIKERRAIANFLDHETAKIDKLIEKQQQLIQLLKEKRQAVISHALTKGLNPNVPMKDSGVEWLGEVPDHWVVCTLRRYANFIDGDRGSEYPNERDFISEGIVFLSSKNIIEEKLDLNEVKFISREKFNALNRGKALNGDLIVKVRGSVGRIGELAKFDTSEHGYETAFINAQMMIIRTRNGLLTDYLRLVSQSLYWAEQLAVGAYGTAQQQLSNDVFANLCFVLPPEEEQLMIIRKLDEDIVSFNDLVQRVIRAIQLMQERRTALISAAVTGKIDVRNWQAPVQP